MMVQNDEVQFTQVEFDINIERIPADKKAKSENNGIRADGKKTRSRRKKGKEPEVSLDKVKTVKEKGIDINSIKTCKVEESKTTSGIESISITAPKVSNNSFIGAVANKSYSDFKANQAELERLRLNKHPYVKSESILTPAEKLLYDYLRANLPDTVTILVKTRLADIVEVSKNITRDTKYFYKIAYKHIDFLICNKENLDIICAVELDDFTHDTDDRRERDQFVEEVLHECYIKLFRIKFRIMTIEKQDIREIQNAVYKYQAPRCPVCNAEMRVLESKRKRNFGHRFYGCTNFPSCQGNIDID